MRWAITEEMIAATIEFHGHSCPGLAIGIRVAEYVRREFGDVEASQLLCVTETDMCGVDGIQFLTGCTFGKGNLIHLDYGKAAFSFYHLGDEKAFRLVMRPEAREVVESPPGVDRREAMRRHFMEMELDLMFSRQALDFAPPRGPRVLQSLICMSCGEETMESRTRRFAGRTLCIPCFDEVEQKR